MRFLSLWALATAIVLSGCASNPKAPLLPMTDAYGEQQTVQRIVLTHGDQRFEFLAGLTLNAQHIQVVGLSQVGQRIFSLNYAGADVMLDSEFSDDIPAEMIVSDIMLAYGDIASLQKILPKHWALQQEGLNRNLYHRHQLIINIRYSPSNDAQEFIFIDHVELGLQLEISSIKSLGS